ISRRIRALEKPRPSRNLGKSISTSRSRSSTGPSRRTSSPASIRTEAALVWSRKASSETAGSSATGSSRKRSTSAIDRPLESFHADTAICVDETFARLADGAVMGDGPLHRIDHARLVEAGTGDLRLGYVLRARAA